MEAKINFKQARKMLYIVKGHTLRWIYCIVILKLYGPNQNNAPLKQVLLETQLETDRIY